MNNERRNAILVAEDNEEDLFLLNIALRKARVLNPVLAVHDGEAAIAYLKGEGPYRDREKFPFPILLLLDLNMPKKSGIEVLAWLQFQSHPKLGVVVLTGISDLKEMHRAYALGAHSFLMKPLVVEDFLNLVKAIKGIRLKTSDEGYEMEFPSEE